MRKSTNINKLNISADKPINAINHRLKYFCKSRSQYLENVAQVKVDELAKKDK